MMVHFPLGSSSGYQMVRWFDFDKNLLIAFMSHQYWIRKFRKKQWTKSIALYYRDVFISNVNNGNPVIFA